MNGEDSGDILDGLSKVVEGDGAGDGLKEDERGGFDWRKEEDARGSQFFASVEIWERGSRDEPRGRAEEKMMTVMKKEIRGSD